MTKTEHRSFQSPDEVRSFENGKLELVNIGGAMVGRFTLQPGWMWSRDVKPMAKTELCMAHHFQYVISGHMHGRMADGSEFAVGPGEVLDLPAGHDAWVVGDEPVVAVDWAGATKYAKK